VKAICATPPEDPNATVERVDRFADGSVKARGPVRDGELEGYWGWFREDGTTLRSGHFARGEPTGEWTTRDSTGAVHEVT